MNIKDEIKGLKKDKIIKRKEEEISSLVVDLMKKMTLQEKIGQLSQTVYYSDVITGPQFEVSDTIKDIKEGRTGSLLNNTNPEVIYTLQKVAVEQSRLHIPLMFMLDVIHGFKTIFPTSIAMSCSFDPDLIEKVCSIAAYEATHCGINVTFSPMLDYVLDSRWGRVNESNGEDPYLSSILAKSYVKGYQKDDLSRYDSIGACAKHFVGYGAVSAGREYNFTNIPEIELRQNYFLPFESAIQSDVLSIMLSFNALNGIPMTMNKKLVKDFLKEEKNFKGFTISDYTASEELINHKVAKDNYDVAKKCIEAGLDQEMVSKCYYKELENVCKDNKQYIEYVNDSCYRILCAKYRLGLFDDPYKNIYDNEKQYYRNKEHLKTAYKIASESLVMLQNIDNLLPLTKKKNIALIGEFVKSHKISGPWGGISDENDNVTIYDAFSNDSNINIIENDYQTADACILCIGEKDWQSGEGGSRSDISLSSDDIALIDKISEINKNIVLVIFAGRPLILTNVIDKVKSIIYAWHLGCETGNVIKDVIMGKISPSGKLTMSFAYNVGQLPISYADYPTGRPINTEADKVSRYSSHYLDCPNKPLFTFGDGMSYNEYTYELINVSKRKLEGKDDSIKVTINITNKGRYDSDEIALMFIEAKCFSITRPYNELKGFNRVAIPSNGSKIVEFIVNYDTLKHYNSETKNVVEDGIYTIKIGGSLAKLIKFDIEYKD